MLRSAAVASLLAILCATPTPARAQDVARAEELIRQANVLRQKGQDVAALPLMRQAYDVARGPRTAAQLGLVELALGYWVDCDDHLNEALAPAKHPWIERNRKVLEDSRAQARSHIARLQIEGSPAGAHVRVNGASIGSLPLSGPIRVGEGHVTIEVKSIGYEDQSRSFDISGGSTQRYSFDLVAENHRESAPVDHHPIVVVTPPAPPPPASPPELPAWRRVLPWGLAGGAVLAAGFGIWQHLQWRHSQSDFDANHTCGSGASGRGGPGCQGLWDDLTSHKTQTYVGYAVAGGVGIGAALVFALNASWNADGKHALVSGPTPRGPGYRGRV
jgi:hypothetical protein